MHSSRKVGLLFRACIPGEEWKKNFYAATVKLLDEMMQARDSSGEILQQFELITIVDAEIGIDMPDQNRIDLTETLLGLVQKTVNGVFTSVRVVETAIPDENLHLQENVLRPLEIGAFILSVLVS